MQKNNFQFSIINYQFTSQSGQIALVVLLLMSVMLTLGLAVTQRGLFDTAVTEQSEQTSRAFQAAETGVEEALRSLVGTDGDKALTGDITYNVTVQDGGQHGFVTEEPVKIGEVVEVDLQGNTANMVDVYYFNTLTDCANSDKWGVEYEALGIDSVITREVYLANVLKGKKGKKQTSGGNYQFMGAKFCELVVELPIDAGTGKIRIRPIGDPVGTALTEGTLLGIHPNGGVFAPQYRLIHSEGRTGSGITRAVNVKRSVPQLPAIFDYALFSGGDIVKKKPVYVPYVPDPSELAVLVSALPGQDITIAASPINVVANFDKPLDAALSDLTITKGGNDVGSGTTVLDVDGLTLRRSVTWPATQDGVYTATYRACVSPTVCTNGAFGFTVQANLLDGYTNKLTDSNFTIDIRSTGLNMPAVRVRPGTRIRWKNTYSGQKRVKSDDHAKHNYTPLISTAAIGNGDSSARVTFTDKGSYFYHVDHNNGTDLNIKGIIVVE